MELLKRISLGLATFTFKQKDGVVQLGDQIQKFLGVVAGQGGAKGLFMTTSSFTRDAIEFEKNNSKLN